MVAFKRFVSADKSSSSQSTTTGENSIGIAPCARGNYPSPAENLPTRNGGFVSLYSLVKTKKMLKKIIDFFSVERLRLSFQPTSVRAKIGTVAATTTKDKLKKDCLVECEDFSFFLNKLEKNSVDLILTDPPYTISRKTGFKDVKNGVKRFAVSMEFGAWDKKKIDLILLGKSMYRVLRRGGTAIVWYDLWKLTEIANAMEAAGFKMLRLLIWQKNNPVPLNMRATYLSNSREIAVVGVKGGSPTFYGSYDNGIYRYPIPRHNGKKCHPTQKPLNLFCELVAKHSNENDLVVDPFLGSGTSAVAALEKGRRFKGCDIDPHYINLAKRRVDNV